MKSFRVFKRIGPARETTEKMMYASLAKGREQLSRVVTVRWYPVSSSAAGVRIYEKRVERTLRPGGDR